MKKKKNSNKKRVAAKKKSATKPAKKKIVKKKTAKKTTKPQKKKKAAPIKAKKKAASKQAAKKTIKKITKAKTTSSKKKLPGYPHYSSNDDIMNPANKTRKINIDSNGSPGTLKSKNYNPAEELDEKPYLSEIKTKKEKNHGKLTKEDEDLFRDDELNPDMGEDSVLKNRVWPVDMSGDDLDIPGSELDDASEILGEEDEENNNYSIGGDRHDDLEENPDSGQ